MQKNYSVRIHDDGKSTPVFASRARHTLAVFWDARRMAVTSITLAALCAIFPVRARAACGFPLGARTEVLLPQQTAGDEVKAQLSHESAPESSSEHERHASIVGLWFVEFTPAGGQSYQGFDVWHSDGTEILNDNSVPPAAGNVCVGVWKQTNDRVIKLRHPGWNFDKDGVLHGTVVLLETITLDPGGRTYRGSFKYEEYDAAGKLTNEATGELRARRMTVD